MKHSLLFMCPHNAAKSVIAAELCRRKAAEFGMSVSIASAGTEPDKEPHVQVVERLRAEGLDVSGHIPRRVTTEDFASATHVLSMGCNVAGKLPANVTLEDWSDVPAPSDDLEASYNRISERVDRFLADLQN